MSMSWLRSSHLIALLFVYAVFGAAVYRYRTQELIPIWQPLAGMPKQYGPWTQVRESVLDKAVLDELKADDTLIRDFVRADGGKANLYIAFFRTQRTGVVPHSPKHCLPANGFVPTSGSIIRLSLPGAVEPIPVNRYVVARGDYRSLVYYWYQSAHRAVASEYLAKLYLIVDSARYRRSDTSLVRVVVPITTTEEMAESIALDFLRNLYGPLKSYLPG